MARGLDHIVHAVADLDAAADIYHRCGFQIGVRNRHPWGTHNHVVQLPGFFIEVLTMAEPEKLGSEGLSQHFGAFQRDAITRGDGFSMLVLESKDSDTDAAAFKQAGIGTSDALPFERQATLPNGKTATVGFSLAFAADPQAPQIGFATCRQHNPEAFWTTAYQAHPNGASAVAGVVLVASQPAAHRDFLKAFTDVDQVEERVAGLFLRTPRGEIDVLLPQSFEDRFGVVSPQSETALIAGLRLAVKDLDTVESVLRENHVPLHRQGATLCVPSQAALGATLIFEQPHIA